MSLLIRLLLLLLRVRVCTRLVFVVWVLLLLLNDVVQLGLPVVRRSKRVREIVTVRARQRIVGRRHRLDAGRARRRPRARKPPTWQRRSTRARIA